MAKFSTNLDYRKKRIEDGGCFLSARDVTSYSDMNYTCSFYFGGKDSYLWESLQSLRSSNNIAGNSIAHPVARRLYNQINSKLG